MSKYTTGELAKLCHVTVRTVQYYDTRGILVPSELSEGGRRLYSDGDLRLMRVICFLRELGLPIDAISRLLHEEHPEEVISLLLDEQEHTLTEELDERRAKLSKLTSLRGELKAVERFTVESIGDIAQVMKRRNELKKIHRRMLIPGLAVEAVEVAGLMLWILRGMWLPFVVAEVAALAVGVGIALYYISRVAYICPECHAVFVPNRREAFFARHTPKTRRLTCTSCGHRGFMVETAREITEENHA